MLWQDLVFLLGASVSIVVLYPTLRSATASVPWETSVSAAVLKVVFGCTFLSMDMLLSAVGTLLAALMWALIALFRRPSVIAPASGDGCVTDA